MLLLNVLLIALDRFGASLIASSLLRFVILYTATAVLTYVSVFVMRVKRDLTKQFCRVQTRTSAVTTQYGFELTQFYEIIL